MALPVAYGCSKTYFTTYAESVSSLYVPHRPPAIAAYSLQRVIEDRGFGGAESRPRYRRFLQPTPPDNVTP